MPDDKKPGPDITAMRTALWCAMHVQLDSPPHVFKHEIGLKLALPEEGWRDPHDVDPQWTRRIRAAIVARARFVEDLVAEQVERGIGRTSSLEPAWTPSPRESRRSPRASTFSKSTVLALKSGKTNVSPILAIRPSSCEGRREERCRVSEIFGEASRARRMLALLGTNRCFGHGCFERLVQSAGPLIEDFQERTM
jgi:hypothetical protein